MNDHFPGKAPKKYYISYLLKEGIGEWDKDMGALKVYNKKISLSVNEKDDLTSLLATYNQKKFALSHKEDIIYKFIADSQIWKWIEIQNVNDKDIISWKYILNKGILSSFAISIYTSSDGYQKETFLLNPEELVYKKVPGEKPINEILIGIKNNKNLSYL